MKTQATALVLLIGCVTVMAGETGSSTDPPQAVLRSILPSIGEPWIPDTKNDRLYSRPSSHMKRVYTYDGRTIEIEARVLREQEQDDARGMLDTYAKGLTQVPGHAVPMVGRGNMSLLSYTGQWIVVEFENNPKRQIQVSGVHKKQPLSFVATAPQQEGALLKRALEQSLNESLDAATSVETPYYVAFTNAEPPIYVFSETKSTEPPPPAIAMVNFIRAAVVANVEGIAQWSEPAMFQDWKQRGQLEAESLRNAADDMKSLVRIELRDVRIDLNETEAHMTMQMLKRSPASTTLSPIVVKVEDRWVVKQMDE